MVKQKTIFVLLAILLVAVVAIGISSLKMDKMKNTSDNVTVAAKTNDTGGHPNQSTKPLPAETPYPLTVIITPDITPEPAIEPDKMPEISISGPDSVAINENFQIDLAIEPKGGIIGIEVNIAFDGNIVDATSVNLINAYMPSSSEGVKTKNSINAISILNDSGIIGPFMTTDFKALKKGDAKIEANILVIDQDMHSARIAASKTVKIV